VLRVSSPAVYVGPAADREIADAVRAGGGTVVASPADADAIVWRGGPEQADELAQALSPRVRWVQLHSAGIERWLATGLVDDGRVWTSAAGAYSEVVAEHALTLVLAGLRRLHEAARSTSWDASLHGRSLRGATVAVVGAGGIGRALISMLAPLRARAVAVTRSGRRVPGAAESIANDRLAEVWPRADVVVLAAPATAETRHLLDAAALAALPSHAWVVNVARGSLVDTDALVRALAHGSIAGAALDVTEPEPLPDDHPLWREPRALITPHTANPPGAMEAALAERVRENVARFRDGRELLGVVELARGY
jgi:D-3-phosphoglycerate dehydrogenase